MAYLTHQESYSLEISHQVYHFTQDLVANIIAFKVATHLRFVQHLVQVLQRCLGSSLDLGVRRSAGDDQHLWRRWLRWASLG